MRVGTEPEFRGASAGVEGTERKVRNYEEWALRMIENYVFVHRLAHAVGFGKGVIPSEEVPDRIGSKVYVH